MSSYNIILEPEILGLLFLFISLLGFIFLQLFIHSWLFFVILFCIYIIPVYLINRRIVSGRSYIPRKNLSGQTVIVTGAATGIGRVCALQFAKLGAHVILGIRGQERAERIANELSKESNGGTVTGYDLDLSSLANVKRFAEKIDQVDILLNNAGLVSTSFSLSADGIENTFATNHSQLNSFCIRQKYRFLF